MSARRLASIWRGARAGAAQARAEAAHVRGVRTALRYAAWLGRRLRWFLRRGPGPWPDAAVGARVLPRRRPSRPVRPPRKSCRPWVDARVDNPVGWTANVGNRVLALGPPALLPPGARARRTVDPNDRAALRRAHHVEDVATFHAGPAERALALARIAAGGVPVHAPDVGGELAERLGGALCAELAAGIAPGIAPGYVDAREAASIRMRRLALRDFALGARPAVSVLLATRRPERLARAVANVARQDWPRLELVLALHGEGFGAVPAAAGLRTRVVRVGAECTLGEALAAAARAASGELFAKMDDDDCYDRHHVLDLVLARAYAGAELVGKGPETVYLAGRDTTVRRGRWRAERYAADIAGGALLVSRAGLAAAGGWRPLPCAVDRALVADVAAIGGGVYRTHGSGFVLVRHGRGHAWAADEGRFLADADDVHRGWRPELAGLAGEPPCAG